MTEPFSEDEAQRIFDRLGAGVPDDRPHLSEFVIGADQARSQGRRTPRRVLLASIAAGAVLVGGGLYAATLLGHGDHTDTPSARPGAPATADQLTGQWTDGSTTIRFLPDVGDEPGPVVQYVDDTTHGEVALHLDGGVQVSGTPDADDPLRSTARIETADDRLRLLDGGGREVAVLSRPPIAPTLPPFGPVTSVKQITGTWDAVQLVGLQQPLVPPQLTITTSWLAAGEACSTYQSDFELGPNGAVRTHRFVRTARVLGECVQPGQLGAAVLGQAATFTLNDGVLGVYDAGDLEIGVFRRTDRLPEVDDPAGSWTPVDSSDSTPQLLLTPAHGRTSGRVSAHDGDCAVAGIWYLTSDGTFVSAVGPTQDSPAGCDEASHDLNAFENISHADLVDGQLVLTAPDGSELIRYSRVG